MRRDRYLRAKGQEEPAQAGVPVHPAEHPGQGVQRYPLALANARHILDRKSTRLNSSH